MRTDSLLLRTTAHWQAFETMRMDWRRPARTSILCPGEVHVWNVSLDGDDRMGGWYSILSTDERIRAERLLSPLKRKRFTRARAALRIILSSYFEVPPDRLCFGYSQKGKPYLLEAGLPSPLEFSISHCEDLMLAVISVAGAVGVDLECVRLIDGRDHIIRQYFSDNDLKSYQSLVKEKRDVAFLSAWTRREALGKAFGTGLVSTARQDYFLPGDGNAVPGGRFELASNDGWWWLRFGLYGEYVAVAAILANQRFKISFLESSHTVLSSRLNGEVFDSFQREPSGVLRV